MPKPFTVQFSDFSGGVTSVLRGDQSEAPKSYARTWNFTNAYDRLIQQNGLLELSNDGGHVVEFEPVGFVSGGQWHKQLHSVMIIHEDMTYEFAGLYCPPIVGGASMGPGSLNMKTVPIYYNGYVVYQKSDDTIWAFGILPTTGSGYLTETQIGPSITFSDNTYFLEHPQDDLLYIFSGRDVHILNVPEDGGYIGNNPYAPYQPLTQYMELGNRNGAPATYTGFGGPQTGTITEVTKMQSLLTFMGYYTGPIDGIYGPLTEAAVQGFQGDNVATGDVPGGQPAGAPLVVDGIFGPETMSAMNAATPGDLGSAGSIMESVLRMPDEITAVSHYGGYIAIAIQDKRGEAIIYFWDRSRDEKNDGWVGIITNCTVGQGIVQILSPVDGDLIAILSPASVSSCVHRYDRLSIYKITASFETLPQSRAELINEYMLRITNDDLDTGSDYQYNRINRKSTLRGSRLYFTGRLHFQHIEVNENDEGAISGIFSVDRLGNLFTEVSRSTDDDDFPYEDVISFGIVDLGFVLSTEGATYVTDASEDDNVSGWISPIINQGLPWADKEVDNIFVALHNTQNLDKIEIWIREIEDIDDNDAGWQLAYTGGTTETKFNNRVVINALENDVPFAHFREAQIMVKLFGIGAELLCITMTGKNLDINE